MKKTDSLFSIKQKKKNFLALCIRSFLLIAIILLYFISSTNFNGNHNSIQQDDVYRYRSRSILAVNQTESIVSSRTTESPLSGTRNHARKNCTNAAILELPSDGLTRDERKQGWIIIHIALACYCFWFLASICDDYFVPAIQSICSGFNLNEDVVGATFMAAAASSPELFINSVGTFITKSDLGVGTIVGSAVFNVLAVPACCGLFAGQIVYLDWWPVSRDSLMYGISVVALIFTLQDGKVMWYEALILVFAYIIYIAVMYWNEIMSHKARTLVAKLRRQSRVRPYRERAEITPLLAAQNGQKQNGNSSVINISNNLYPILEVYEDYADTPYKVPHDINCCAYLLKWPIILVLWLTVPDCRKRPKLTMMTFCMCIAWIGLASYAVAMLITIVGDTANVPDSVMGLTFLAAGTSLPEAVSSVIVTNQGHGAMGISSSISSNTFDILLCLGIPWFLKAYFDPDVDGQNWISLNSSGITYSAISLLSTLIGLYVALALNKYKLDWKIGVTCLLMYMAFLALASLIELNVFFPVNLPTCPH
ncbi:sodium/potassium/calcium exchanger 3-like isoform X2 [Sitodiplosis mosellana]|uniref:sodium/potassium/calcium exchanger 3-like isoform X2 n=1 Tax=Sitodiplosis mosellana TaxID=263140 RepID=UPI0024451AB6|nr:sodium/potassium/calcium exchanger 3-like isoform X2 [Sitodiplosis mosellana]